MRESLQLQLDSKDQLVSSLKSHLDTYTGGKGTDFTTMVGNWLRAGCLAEHQIVSQHKDFFPVLPDHSAPLIC